MFIFHTDIHFSLRGLNIHLNAVQVLLFKKRDVCFSTRHMFDSHMQCLLHDFYGQHFLSTSCMVRRNENVAKCWKDIKEGVYYLSTFL